VRTEHVAAGEIEFVRWKAERWMKLRHMPKAFLHDPWFITRNGPQMFAHTFRGSTIRSILGLEDKRKTFARYQSIRRKERDYLPEMASEHFLPRNRTQAVSPGV